MNLFIDLLLFNVPACYKIQPYTYNFFKYGFRVY